MTNEQMAKLAARLRELRKAYLGTFSEHNESDIRLAADLDSAAELIAGMAQRVPLSDDDVEALAFRADTQGGGEGWAIYFARLIEQAHGIRSEK